MIKQELIKGNLTEIQQEGDYIFTSFDDTTIGGKFKITTPSDDSYDIILTKEQAEKMVDQLDLFIGLK